MAKQPVKEGEEMENGHNNADHRELLRGQADVQSLLQQMLQQQGATLKSIEAMRSDMRSMMMEHRKEARDEAKALRDEVGDIHARINETDRIARATATQMSAITWGLRGAWGAIVVGAIGIVSALIQGGG